MDKIKALKIVKWITAFILLAAVIVGSVVGICYSLKGKTKTTVNENKSTLIADTDTNGNTTTVQGNGMKLTSTAVSGEEAAMIDATADGITILTATIEPSNAFESTLIWSVTGTYADQIKIMDGNTGTKEIKETQSGESVYVICAGAFNEQVIITITAKDDNSIYTEIACEYAARLNSDAGYSFSLMEDVNEYPSYYFADTDEYVTWKLNEFNYKGTNSLSYDIYSISYDKTALTGTIFDTYTVTRIYLDYTEYVEDDEYFIGCADFLEIYDGNITCCGLEYAIDYGIYDGLNNLNAEIYEDIQGYYESGNPIITCYVTLVGDTYGFEYTFSFDVLVDFSNYYVGVEDVLSATNAIVF